MSSLQDPNLKIWQRSRALSRPFWALYERFVVPRKPEPSNNYEQFDIDLAGVGVELSEHEHEHEHEQEQDQQQPQPQPQQCTTTNIHHDSEDYYSDDSDELVNEDGEWNIGEVEPDYDEEDEDEYFQYDGEENDDDEYYDYEEEENDGTANPEYLEFIKVTRKHQAERERLKQLPPKANDEPEEYYVDVSQVNTLVERNLVEAPSISGEFSGGQKERDEELVKLYGSQEAFERIRSMEMNIDEHFNDKCIELKPKFWPVIPLNPKPYLNPVITDLTEQ